MLNCISYTDFVWITRKGYHIICSEWIGLIFYDNFSNLRKIDAIISCTIASNILNWLEYNSSDTFPFLCMGNEFRNLFIIESLVNHTDKSCRDIVFFEHFQCFLSRRSHISVSYSFECISIQRIKLEIDLESFSNILEFLYEFLILRYTNTIRVEHQMTNRTRLQVFQNPYNIWMDTRFSASYLYEIRGRLHGEKCLMHFFDLVHRSVVTASRFRRVIADIAFHIAFINHIEEGETRMILMLWTNSTVKWTTSKNRSECFFWKIWFLEVVVTLTEVFEIIGYN